MANGPEILLLDPFDKQGELQVPDPCGFFRVLTSRYPFVCSKKTRPQWTGNPRVSDPNSPSLDLLSSRATCQGRSTHPAAKPLRPMAVFQGVSRNSAFRLTARGNRQSGDFQAVNKPSKSLLGISFSRHTATSLIFRWYLLPGGPLVLTTLRTESIRYKGQIGGGPPFHARFASLDGRNANASEIAYVQMTCTFDKCSRARPAHLASPHQVSKTASSAIASVSFVL